MPEVQPSRKQRLAIIVLGMHRSGTSALTRMLSLLGAALPTNLLGANSSNPFGHWEPADLVSANDRLLEDGGSRWDDWRSFNPARVGNVRLIGYYEEIAKLISDEYQDEELIVVKDPRLCRFSDPLHSALENAGYEPRYVLTYRDPKAVISSLSSRDDIAPGLAALLWLRHVLDAEFSTRGHVRVITSYEGLLNDWRAVASRISSSLGLTWKTDGFAKIDCFLKMKGDARALSNLSQPSELIDSWLCRTRDNLAQLESDPMDTVAHQNCDEIRQALDRLISVFDEQSSPVLRAREAYRREQYRTERTLRVEAEKKIRHVTQDFEQATQNFEEARSKLVQKDAVIRGLESRIEEMKNSISWRVTRPLRALSS